ncbi:uncharacterized protein LOC111088396 isoform X2 [Limulus polyphemus]|uniref:Uncharacterized protein LOC111088396 isoform X2 n=1 Tax=Limulus polyphemus TaxID=6850 RepID=A0ABM1TE07_LIMPO|nr:uncharacterized protein LOC111088396 isoform X2 [Limulus polyphemus]
MGRWRALNSTATFRWDQHSLSHLKDHLWFQTFRTSCTSTLPVAISITKQTVKKVCSVFLVTSSFLQTSQLARHLKERSMLSWSFSLKAESSH